MKSKKFLEWFSSSEKSFGVCLQPAETDKEGPLFRGQKCQLFIHQLAKSFVDKCHAAAKDSKLTPEGKRDTVQRHAAQALAELRQGYKKFLDPILNAYKNFDSTHLPALRRAVTPLEGIERMRLQQYVTGLETKARVELLNNALAENDELMLSVFFDRPQVFRLLDPQYIAQVRRKYMSEHAPALIQAEKAGAVLTFDIEKVTDELSFFCPGSNENVTEIHKDLAEIKKLGMTFEKNGDLQMMLIGAVPSSLPELSNINP